MKRCLTSSTERLVIGKRASRQLERVGYWDRWLPFIPEIRGLSNLLALALWDGNLPMTRLCSQLRDVGWLGNVSPVTPSCVYKQICTVPHANVNCVETWEVRLW
jgi:hypothetical protein